MTSGPNKEMSPEQDFRQKAESLLRRFYGYSSFRPGQLEIITGAMKGKDSVVLMPTGGGKSICYQIPALMAREGSVIVVSPLISLMNDQVTALRANGIPAAAVNSNQSETENREIMDALFRGHVKILYISPERLVADLPRLSSDLHINLIAIDEAHCISQWGHDFRPVYTQLAILKERFLDVPVMALTATADRLTREDIATQLRLKEPELFISSFDRPNISLKVIDSASKRERVNFICRMIDKYRNDSGIVYCLSRKASESLAQALSDKGYRVAVYHAGMTAAQRNESQRLFINGDVQVVCATVAFGMGIDKSNIRWVVHNNMPRNIESYYQEIGRAGRDGMDAEAVMFYSYSDVITLRSFADESGQPGLNNEKLDRMVGFAEAKVCRRRMLLSYFNEEMDHDCGNCDVCLAPPRRVDGTILAMKAMSATARVGETVGINMLVDILRGSARAEVVAAGYNKIKTYGAGRDLPYSDWAYYIGQMIQLGLFEVAYNESNHLKITPYGRRILHGEASIMFSEMKRDRFGRRERKKTTLPEVKLSPDELLLDSLKELRTKIAKKEGIPPYMVLSDKSLADIVAKKPQTLREFGTIEGVGEHKLVKYWRPFVTQVCTSLGTKAPELRGSSENETLELFNQGFDIDQIAKIKGIQARTVYGHFTKLIDEDRIHDFRRLISRAQYLHIMSVHDSHPDDWLIILASELPKGMPRMALAISGYLLRHKS